MHERDQLQSDISSKEGESEDLRQKDARINKLELELENWQNRLPPLIEKFRQRNEDAERLESDLAAAQMRISELEATSESVQTRIEPVRDPDTLTDGRDACNDPIEDNTTDDEPEDEGDVESQEEPEAEVEIQEEPDLDEDEDEDEDEDDDSINEPINGARDKLQAIKGIGPAIEKTLNEMGIFRFQQIADMSEYDIDRIAQRLKGLRSRIYREDWIGQARDLRDQELSS